MSSFDYSWKRVAIQMLMVSAGLFFASCKHETTSEPTTPQQNSITIKVQANTGDTLKLTNSQGDEITLAIPPWSLDSTIMITVLALKAAPVNPIAKNIFPGVNILPDGIVLERGARLSVHCASGQLDTTRCMLMYVKNAAQVLPIGDRRVTPTTLEGTIYHFSNYSGGEPTSSEADDQSSGLNGFIMSSPLAWGELYDYVNARLMWWDYYYMTGQNAKADVEKQEASQAVNDAANAILNMPPPQDPCGAYKLAVAKIAELVWAGVVDDEGLSAQMSDLVTQVNNKCLLTGTLEYNHDLTISSGNNYHHEIVTGTFPFSVNTVVEPIGQIQGGGSGTITLTGAAGDCTYSGGGKINVTLGGEETVDEMGAGYLEFTLDESWYCPGSIINYCPNGTTSSQLPCTEVTPKLRILLQDGVTSVQPFLMGSGSYTYTLHITRVP